MVCSIKLLFYQMRPFRNSSRFVVGMNLFWFYKDGSGVWVYVFNGRDKNGCCGFSLWIFSYPSHYFNLYKNTVKNYQNLQILLYCICWHFDQCGVNFDGVFINNAPNAYEAAFSYFYKFKKIYTGWQKKHANWLFLGEIIQPNLPKFAYNLIRGGFLVFL